MSLLLALSQSALGPAAAQQSNPPPPLPPKTGETGPVMRAPQSGAGKQQGVIQPPAVVDPGMPKVTPDTRRYNTPVVPPPGTPGGNPAVQPK